MPKTTKKKQKQPQKMKLGMRVSALSGDTTLTVEYSPRQDLTPEEREKLRAEFSNRMKGFMYSLPWGLAPSSDSYETSA